MTRRPTTADLPGYVEVVGGDLADPASLGDALRDVDRVFAVSTGPAGPVQDRDLAVAAAKAGADRNRHHPGAGVGVPDRELSRLLATTPRTFRAWVRDHAAFAR